MPETPVPDVAAPTGLRTVDDAVPTDQGLLARPDADTDEALPDDETDCAHREAVLDEGTLDRDELRADAANLDRAISNTQDKRRLPNSTDVKLMAWREEAGERRWTADQLKAQAAKRRRLQLFAMGALAIAVIGVGVLAGLNARYDAPELIADAVPAQGAISAVPNAEPAATKGPAAEPEAPTPVEAAAAPIDAAPPEAEASPAEATPVVEAVAPTAAGEGWELASEVQTWLRGSYAYVQFDYRLDAPLHLRWLSPDGQVRMDDYACSGRVRGDLRRCYVGRGKHHFTKAISEGAPATGDWTIQACTSADAGCIEVASFPFEA